MGRTVLSGAMVQAYRASTPIEVLAGLVERVTFHNEDNGFCFLQVKARGQRDLITVLGHAAMIAAGEFVQASGSWVNDRMRGVQFKASFLKATAPTTIEGIEKYEPVSAGPRHPRHRLPHCRSDRGQDRHREDRADPCPCRDLLRARRGHGGRALRSSGRGARLPHRKAAVISVTTAPGARLSATIARFCSALQRRRRSGPVITSTRAIAPSLTPMQTPSFAPVLTSPSHLSYARRPSPAFNYPQVVASGGASRPI